MRRFALSEPHRVSEPPKKYPKARVLGIVHERWRGEALAWQMGCGFATTSYEHVDIDTPVTCVWCVTHYLPWLRWTEDAYMVAT
jgi:hypothetical protein